MRRLKIHYMMTNPLCQNNLSLSSGHVTNWIELTGSLLPNPDLLTQFLSSQLRKYKS